MSVHDALSLVDDTLADALEFFCKGTAAANPPTQADTIVVLHSIVDIARSCDPDHFAVALEHTRVYARTCALTVEPLVYSLPAETGASLQQTFLKVRLAAMDAVSEMVKTLAASQRGRPDPKLYASLDYLESMLSHVAAPVTFEVLRLHAAQTIFALVVALPQRLPPNYVQAVVQCAVVEPAPMVRSAILCVLRELCTTNAAALEVEMPTFFKLIEVDNTSDVRLLASEVLSAIASRENIGDHAAAVLSIRRRLEGILETDTAEAASLGMLVDRLCVVDPAEIYSELCRQGLERAMIHAAVVTMVPELLVALRRCVDRCPPDLRLGQHLLANFQAFSGLLKIVLDCHGAHDDSYGGRLKQCGVEAAAAVSIMLAQSPAHRQHMKRELHAFPMWATTLKESILHFLNATSLDFYSDVDLVDFSNVRLNDFHDVNWNEQERPHRASIQSIFSAQEARFAEGTIIARPTPRLELLEAEERRRNKLTFVVLSYAVHATLADDPASIANPVLATAQSPAASATLRTQYQQHVQDQQQSHPASHRDPHDPTPRFPTPRSTRKATLGKAQMAAVTPAEKQELAYAYDRFDSAFKLTRHFAKYYAQGEARQPVYEATDDGFVVRQQQLRNPWGPIVKKQQTKSWAVRDLKEGDLFYFAIPFDELSRTSVECVIERLRRHSAALKRIFVTTPQSAKGRRWLIYDLMNNVLPSIEGLLRKVHDLLGDYGDDNVRFPVFLFREKEMHLGERALHCGNLTDVVDQVTFYFTQNPIEIFGAPDDAQAITRLEERLRELTTSGVNTRLPDSDDEGGHGALSSDSDGDD
jgi:hypothetical protein